MNTVALRFLIIILMITVLALAFARFSKRELVQRARENIAWLLKISFFDFVRMIIFIKPLKNYTEQVGVFLWLILAFVTGRYLIVSQPGITEISGPYIPMIGYIYYLSVLLVISLVLWVASSSDG